MDTQNLSGQEVQSAAQEALFKEVKRALAGDLTEVMGTWSYVDMLSALRQAIFDHKPPGGNPVRHFARHYLGMRGPERFKLVSKWLARELLMSEDEMILVLRTLIELGQETPVAVQRDDLGFPCIAGDIFVPGLLGSGVESVSPNRKLVDHGVTVLNSLSALATAFAVTPEQVNDGDRMQISSALEVLCKAFGIKAKFSGPDMARSRPVTREDFPGSRRPKGQK